MTASFRPPSRRRALGLMLAHGAALAAAAVLPAAIMTVGPAASALDFSDAAVPLPPHPRSPAADGVRLLVLPFEGIPTTTGDAIYREMRRKASKRKYSLAMQLSDPASFRVLIYFSAVTTGSGTTILYRIDIFDPAGRPVTRLFGEELGPTATGDPWSGVDKKTVEHLAGRLGEQLQAWVTRAAD